MTVQLPATIVASMVGLTYRQFDYLLQQGVVPYIRHGKGNHREWEADVLHRVEVAVALNRAVVNLHGTTVSVLPAITRLTLEGPEPTGNWVALRQQSGVHYGHTVASLFPRHADNEPAIVARVPELWP